MKFCIMLFVKQLNAHKIMLSFNAVLPLIFVMRTCDDVRVRKRVKGATRNIFILD